MSVSDCGLYSDPYKACLFNSLVIRDIPYVNGKTDPLWSDAKHYWDKTEEFLEQNKQSINALIVEPLCQGAGGMLLYSKDYLSRLCSWCKQNDIYIIFDEIMTGVGRLGKLFALDYLDISPDLLCISKGITSGMIPFSVTLTKNQYYDMFYKDKMSEAFLHSHTHSGNILGVVAANSVLDIFEQENILDNVTNLETLMHNYFSEIQQEIPIFKNIRNLGGMIAADLDIDKYRFGFDVYTESIKLGALLRPLGNTLYWLPPLNSKSDDIIHLKQVTKQAIINAVEKL
jgi:adenosylmethionine-8-amino-7-oxononanoate aminotransferase